MPCRMLLTADIHIDTYADAQVEHGHGQRQVRLHQRVPFQELPEPVAQDLNGFVAVQIVIGKRRGEALRQGRAVMRGRAHAGMVTL